MRQETECREGRKSNRSKKKLTGLRHSLKLPLAKELLEDTDFDGGGAMILRAVCSSTPSTSRAPSKYYAVAPGSLGHLPLMICLARTELPGQFRLCLMVLVPLCCLSAQEILQHSVAQEQETNQAAIYSPAQRCLSGRIRRHHLGG